MRAWEGEVVSRIADLIVAVAGGLCTYVWNVTFHKTRAHRHQQQGFEERIVCLVSENGMIF